MSSPTWESLSLDQTVALRQAANRLAGEFDGVLEPRRHRFRYFSYDQFAGRATVAKFLPLMGERFARQQLRAQAVRGLAGHDPAGQDLDTVRRIRDDVERRVRALLDELHLPVPVGSGQRGPAMRK